MLHHYHSEICAGFCPEEAYFVASGHSTFELTLRINQWLTEFPEQRDHARSTVKPVLEKISKLHHAIETVLEEIPSTVSSFCTILMDF